MFIPEALFAHYCYLKVGVWDRLVQVRRRGIELAALRLPVQCYRGQADLAWHIFIQVLNDAIHFARICRVGCPQKHACSNIYVRCSASI